MAVSVKGDTTVEPNETFVVNLSNLTNVGAGDVQGQGTIVNDDTAAAPPIVTGYSVAAATVGKKITVTGSHFTGATSVAFSKAGGGTVNGTTLKVLSDTQLTIKVPNLATTGVVSVTTPAGTGVGPVLKIKATITGFTPTHGTSGSPARSSSPATRSPEPPRSSSAPRQRSSSSTTTVRSRSRRCRAA